MTSLESVFTRFEEVLNEERIAITDVRTDKLVELAHEKERLMRALTDADVGADAAATLRLATLTQNIRDNLVLLVHAKACLRDVVEAMTAKPATYQATGAVAAPTTGSQISITG